MAMFGFNKAKVLASAEKYVQQGKLQNAISEYEKVIKEDPRDLTVLNTIGDLYARVGKNDAAVKFFQLVGDYYATDGFTVKAIAMYKKLTKLTPGSMEAVKRLAELYTVQGLYNDARQQYVQIADYWLKSGQNEEAAKSFQKILELDPDNTAMQSKLADLYMKLGKKNEARNIYFTAAQSLYSKQSLDAADDALDHVLRIDPKNVDALLLRGTVAAESGNAALGIKYLQSVPDTDSRPDALKSLLRAYIQLKQTEEAGPLAQKLLTVHNDLSGITWFAEALLNNGQHVEALQLYQQHADKVLATGGQALVKTLTASISKVKDSPRALELLKDLLLKAGESSHAAEITELLAHAYVQDRQLAKARDLYQQLAEQEPENSLHQQNYKQVIAMMGEDSAAQPLTAEQGGQALMIEAVDPQKGPGIKYDYAPEVETKVRAALTDCEIFLSYNLPSKAIPILEQALTVAPNHHQLLALVIQMYVRAERFADAARYCALLSEILQKQGFPQEAEKYASLAKQYGQPMSSIPPEPSVALLSLDLPAVKAPPVEASAPAEFSVEAEPVSVVETVPVADATSHELNLDTEEWESMLSVESPTAAAPPPAATAEFSMEVTPPVEIEPEAPLEATVAEFSFETGTIHPVIEPPAPQPPPPVIQAPPSPPPPKAPPAAAKAATPPPAPKPVAKPAPPPPPPAVEEEVDLLGDLVADLDSVLGDDFLSEAPAPQPPKHAATPPPKTAKPAAAAAAAAASASAPPLPAGLSSMAKPLPQEKPQIKPQEAASVLSDLFEEFKEDAEAAAGELEDPETHYNLGIAFKEMGLLDEAIGELQKVCNAVDRGHKFPQAIQAYTWLAQCLLDKGVPKAAIRWYEKALKIAHMSEESKLAVYYDLGCAHELAGNQREAYETFMEVYSSNIDYRDVADRIKTLKV